MPPSRTEEPADDVTAPSARQATGAGAEELPCKLQQDRSAAAPALPSSSQTLGRRRREANASCPIETARDRNPPTTSFMILNVDWIPASAGMTSKGGAL